MTRRKLPHERVMNRRYGGRWTPEADEILTQNYGHWLPENVARRINFKLGTKFTTTAIESRADALGLSGKDCQGLLTLAEAARRVGIPRSNLHHYIMRNKLETTGRGGFRYLTDETWEIIQRVYARPPEPCTTTRDAGKRLHYTREGIVDMIEAGKLRAWKRGNKWMVSLADVERLERIQRGRTRIGDIKR